MSDNGVWNLIQDLSGKRGIKEIAINDFQKVFVERDSEFIQLKVNLSEEDVNQFIEDVAKLNKRECNSRNPILDGTLPDGSRINVIIPPYVEKCPAITIRKYLRTIKSFHQGDDVFGILENAVPFFKAIVRSRCNVLVSGGTGSGKTTFLNLLLNEVEEEDRIVTIEDTYELSSKQNNLVRLITRKEVLGGGAALSARDLVKNSLRMRPDRIIIGEVRGEEVFDLLQAMNTGHEGSMSTLHANNSRECMRRLETLFLLSGFEVPLQAVRHQISSAIDYVVQLNRTREGKHIVSEVHEITGIEGEAIQMQKIAEHRDGRMMFTGLAPMNIDKLTDHGLARDYFA